MEARLEGEQRQHARRHSDERLVRHDAQLGHAAVGNVVDLVNVLQQEPAASVQRCSHVSFVLNTSGSAGNNC